MVNIAVLGYGTVGSGVVEVINTNHKSINKRAGAEINVKYVLDLRDFPGDPVEKVLVHDYEIIANDPEVDIVVEVMGGIEPAYTFVKRALESGKSVCTSNKALVAKHGPELMEIASAKNINFLFEASCGGGIPIIRALNSSLTADEIDEITGILNGTTNYMMYKMATEGSEFDAVLKEAQQKGYAEADPTADVEGYDACRKIGDDSFYAMVAPFLVGQTSPLYSVNDVFNAVFVHGNVLGDAMFYGSGAGKLPTASAVVADVVDEAKHLHRNIMTNWSSRPLKLMTMDEVEGRFFVRVKGTTVEQVEAVFDNVQIVNLKNLPGEFGFITECMKQGTYEEKVHKLNGNVITMIRVKD